MHPVWWCGFNWYERVFCSVCMCLCLCVYFPFYSLTESFEYQKTKHTMVFSEMIFSTWIHLELENSFYACILLKLTIIFIVFGVVNIFNTKQCGEKYSLKYSLSCHFICIEDTEREFHRVIIALGWCLCSIWIQNSVRKRLPIKHENNIC